MSQLQKPTDVEDAASQLGDASVKLNEIEDQLESSDIDTAISELDDVITALQTIRDALEEMK